MKEVVSLDGFCLMPQGPTLSLGLPPGQSVVIVGRSQSGKSRLLRCLIGLEKAAQGSVTMFGSASVAGPSVGRRATPESIARKFAGRKVEVVAEALHSVGLWDSRGTPLSDLTSGQIAAVELLPCLCVPSPVLVIDGQLDRLDPWARSSCLEALQRRVIQGAVLIVSTNIPELVREFDLVLVLSKQRIRFASTPEELLRSVVPSTITVRSRNQPGVLAVVEPFKISIEKGQDEVTFRAEEGQQLAANLLLEGYGDVEFVVLREPRYADAIAELSRD